MTDVPAATPTSQFVAKLAVKLPDFWTDDPDLWFLHAESAFRNSQVTQSQTKFDHVIQKLPQNIMVSVRGLIMNATSSSTPYEDLKAKLVSSYTLTRWQRINKLIHHPALGDRRPTALMDAMLTLLPDDEVPSATSPSEELEEDDEDEEPLRKRQRRKGGDSGSASSPVKEAGVNEEETSESSSGARHPSDLAEPLVVPPLGSAPPPQAIK